MSRPSASRGAPLLALALACSAPAEAASAASPACPALPARAPMPAEATPRPVPVDEWRRRDEELDRSLRGRDLGRVRLAFVGHSIMQGWDPVTWALFWGGLSPLNLGLWGDTTSGALWRLGAGRWPASLHPDVAVVLIGTNDANWGSRAEDTALGVAEVVRLLRARSPSTKVLLLGLLPRGRDASAPERAVNAAVNALVRGCADGRGVSFLDPGAALAGPDGRIPPEVLFDGLHPTMVGYAILGGAIRAEVLRLMGR